MCVCVCVSCPKINEKQKSFFFWLEKEIRIQTHNQRIKWKQKQSQTSKRRCIFCFVLLIYWSKSGDHYTNTHITRLIKIIVSIIFSSFSFENLKKNKNLQKKNYNKHYESFGKIVKNCDHFDYHSSILM